MTSRTDDFPCRTEYYIFKLNLSVFPLKARRYSDHISLSAACSVYCVRVPSLTLFLFLFLFPLPSHSISSNPSFSLSLCLQNWSNTHRTDIVTWLPHRTPILRLLYTLRVGFKSSLILSNTRKKALSLSQYSYRLTIYTRSVLGQWLCCFRRFISASAHSALVHIT